MTYVLFITAAAYAAVILFLLRGLYRLERAPPSPQAQGDDKKFSVVIAARDEERNIRECLRTVFAQDIPPDCFEVIVVDDRSRDATPDILRDMQREFGADRLKIVTVNDTPPNTAPKKYAVSQGVFAASNEIIVFTDADCRVSGEWLSSVGRHFCPDTGLVQGITCYTYADGMNRLFFGLQAADFLSHGVVAAAAIGAGLPINSNANNFAFRKAAFEDVGGYGDDGNRIVSGDDDYMLQKIWRSGRDAIRRRKADAADGSATGQQNPSWKIRFMTDPAGSVETAPTRTAAGVFEQRKRWGSKTVHYHAGQILLLASVFAFYLATLVTAAAAVVNIAYLPVFASMLLVKLSGEMVLMIPGTRIFKKKSLRKYIIPASLIQLPLVVAAVFGGVFGRFEWKGGRMRRVVQGTEKETSTK